MKNDLFSEDAFFRFDLEESATIEAVIVGSGAVAIFLYACHGIITANEEPLITKRVIGHLSTDDFSIFWDEDDLKMNSYAIMDEVEWKTEMPKYELWPQCLDGLIKAYQVALVMTT